MRWILRLAVSPSGNHRLFIDTAFRGWLRGKDDFDLGIAKGLLSRKVHPPSGCG
jgi:hypothetical protein